MTIDYMEKIWAMWKKQITDGVSLERSVAVLLFIRMMLKLGISIKFDSIS